MKSVVKLFLLFSFIVVSNGLFAKTYQLQDFSVDIPDSFKMINSDELLLYLVDNNTGNAISVVYGGAGSFGSHDPLYKYGDLTSHKTRKSFFLRLNKKYVKSYYKTNTVSLMQYTFATYNKTYSFLYKYASEQDIKNMDSVIKSIKIKDSWIKKVLTVLRNGSLIWALFFIIVSIIAAALHNGGEAKKETAFSAIFITLFSIPFLLLFLWGTWDLLLFYIALTFLVSYIAARTGYYLAPNSD